MSAKKCGIGALVEVNCETDFVAKTDKFKSNCVNDVAKHIVANDPADVEALLAQKFVNDEIRPLRIW